MDKLYVYRNEEWSDAKEITNTHAGLVADRGFVIQNAVAQVEQITTPGFWFGRPSPNERWVPLLASRIKQSWSTLSDITDEPGWQFGSVCPPWDHVIWEPCACEPGMNLADLWVGLVDSACCDTEWYKATAKDIELGPTQLRRVTGGARLVKWQQLFTRDGMEQGNAIVVNVDNTGDRPMYDIVTDFGNVCPRMSIDKAADGWYFHRRGEFVIGPDYPRTHVGLVNKVWSRIAHAAGETDDAGNTRRSAEEIVMYALEAYDVDPKTVTRATPIIDLPVDSLDMVMLIGALEEDVFEEYKLSVEISDEEVESWKTVGDVITHVERACTLCLPRTEYKHQRT